jgi:alkylated DNA repair dioxygenase AlkB
MGYHADDEPELRPPTVEKDAASQHSDITIASVSFGAERRFLLRPKERHQARLGKQPIEYSLGSGSLLVMGGCTQDYWKHAVPKMLRVTEPRINLTFRTIYPRGM